MVVSSDGSVKVYAGTMATGQGHETAWTQILVEKLGVNPEDVSVHFGDSDDLPGGGGTGGSKSLYMAAGAINDASEAMLKKGIEIAANELEASVDDIEYTTNAGPLFEVKGTNRNIDLFSVARLAEGQSNTQILDGESAYEHKDPTFPNGCHVCEVSIDKETGRIEIDNYSRKEYDLQNTLLKRFSLNVTKKLTPILNFPLVSLFMFSLSTIFFSFSKTFVYFRF